MATPKTAAAPHTLEPRPTVHVLLSPRMPLALREWPRMRAAAQAAGFRTQPWRDARVPLAEWQAALHAMRAQASHADVPAAAAIHQELWHAPVLDTPCAAQLGLANHTPAALVQQGMRTHPWPILGVMPNGAWLATLRQRAQCLQQTPCP